jgi:hypothetical protein
VAAATRPSAKSSTTRRRLAAATCPFVAEATIGDAWHPCAEAAQPYRDRTWLAARQRANLPDLDQIFSATMKETEPMPRQIAVEIILPGLHQPLRMPAFAPPDAAAALGMLDHWRVREEVDPHIADRAERLIDPLGRAASS